MGFSAQKVIIGSGVTGPIYLPGTYLVVGASGKSSNSLDGKTFTANSATLGSGNIIGVKYIGTNFHAFKSTSDTTNNNVVKSSNATTFAGWGANDFAFTPRQILATSSIIWFGGLLSSNSSSNIVESQNNGTTASEFGNGGYINNAETLSYNFGASGGVIVATGNPNGGGGFASTATSNPWSPWYSTHISGNVISFANFINSTHIYGHSNGDISYTTATLTNSDTAFSVASAVIGANQVNCVINNGTNYVAVGAPGKISYASALNSWSAATSGVSGAIATKAIAYNGSTVIVGTASGEIATSTNSGQTWSVLSSSNNPFLSGAYSINFVKYLKGNFYAGGQNGILAASSDGLNFNSLVSGFGTTTINDMDAI